MGVELSTYTKKGWSTKRQESINAPTSSFNSVFLSQAPLHYQDFLNQLKIYINKGTATGDNYSYNIGRSVVNSVRKIVLGDKYFFEGQDDVVSFLTDKWQPKVNFYQFLSSAVNDLLVSGTVICKLSTTDSGWNVPQEYRADRVLFTLNTLGDIVDVFFFCGTFGIDLNKSNKAYYSLLERRYFNEKGMPSVIYKVMIQTGTTDSPNIPNLYGNGIAFENLPLPVKKELAKIGITQLNKEKRLPFYDGLGCYLMKLTPLNSISPDLPYGDPLLYGSLPTLRAIDLLMLKSDCDIQLSRAIVMLPREMFKNEEFEFLKPPKAGEKTDDQVSLITFLRQDLPKMVDSMKNDDLFQAILPPDADGNMQPPQFIQPELRGEQNRYALETYETELANNCGISPTSIFPNLADNSPKTATEITAQENKTRATIHEIHSQIIPPIEKMLAEVLKQEGDEMGKQKVSFKLSDYIGNKLQEDDNIRQNYQAGILTKSKAVQKIGGLSFAETQEDLKELEEQAKQEQQSQMQGLGFSEFNDVNYYNGGASINGDDDNRAETITGDNSDRRNEDNNSQVSDK